ncbi:peptidoglycan-binding domain-containing protein [Lachnospiraceae bacterium 54-11]
MLLQKGSKGDEVKNLQSRLIELGYICGTGTADGIYGNGTYNSVKDFQRLNGLSVDGIAGPDTLTTLYSADPERYEFIPETGDIAGYAVNAISRWEGNYTSINPREPISIGILQWYQERAHDLLRSIREQDARLVENILGKDSVLANELKQDRSVFSGRYLTNEEKVVLTNLLNTQVSRKIQDKAARIDVEGYIENGKRKGITDEKALIYYADLGAL